MLAALKGAQIIELDHGAAAVNVAELWNQLAARQSNQGISLYTSRPWQNRQLPADSRSAADKVAQTQPTHLLYGHIAYPISEQPLIIGCASDGEQNDIAITREAARISFKHCTIELRGGEIVLNVLSDQAVFVDEKRVSESNTLKLGQIIRIGTPAQRLQMIACL
jgi:hypothetical protein